MPLSTNMSNIFFLVYFSLEGWMSLRTFGIKRRESAFAQNLNVYHAHNSPHGVRMLRIEVIEISPIVRPVLRLPNAVVYILDLVRILPNFGIPDKRETTRYEKLVAEVRGIIGFRRLVSFLNPDGYRLLSVCEYHSSLLLFLFSPCLKGCLLICKPARSYHPLRFLLFRIFLRISHCNFRYFPLESHNIGYIERVLPGRSAGQASGKRRSR